jgi:hypothetical protein
MNWARRPKRSRLDSSEQAPGTFEQARLIREQVDMRRVIVLVLMALFSATSALAQVSIGIGMPGVSIGINLPMYPQLVRVPGYPVYYAPQLSANFFFYDGLYWVYRDDNWYASSWYNGPWRPVVRDYVPLFVLRVPVRYYRQPPPYFHGWHRDAPPRWGERWGHEWEQKRSGWDTWNHKSAPGPAPLPTYQRSYSGERYPKAERQQELHRQQYRYQPRDPEVRQHYQAETQQQRSKQQPQHEQRQQQQQHEQRQQQQHEQRQQQPKQQQGASQQSGQQAPSGQDRQQATQGDRSSRDSGQGQGQGGDHGKGDGRGQGKGN